MEIRKPQTPQQTGALLAGSLLLAYCALVGAATLANNHEQQLESLSESFSVTARTSSGLLRGVRQLAATGPVIKFLNVPYAEAPVGALRFKRPVELRAERANDILNASKLGKTCPQFRHLTKFISPLLNVDADHQTSEDCLRLNVFVPASVGSPAASHDGQLLEPNRQLPVIVWIPGEGFDFADARQFDGSILALKTQSIVVTVQYRVGVLGFLNAPKLNITGNMGVYDQIEALKWVHRNIAAFGGDPGRVTLMGRFTGSMSISAMISAPSEQLLQLNGKPLASRVALLSGIAVDDWIIEADQQQRVAGLERAAIERQYCTGEQVARGACLGALTAEQLTRAAGYGWRLVRDSELIGERAPIEAIRANQLAGALEAVLIGETAMEGTICLYRHILEAHTNYAQLIDEDRLTASDLYEMIRYDSQTYFGLNPNKTSPIQVALESLIEGSSSDSGAAATTSTTEQESRLRDKYLNACSSYMVRSHSNRFKRNVLARNRLHEIRLDSSKRPVEVHHYELKYKPTFSLAPEYIRSAAHGDDIPLIFGLVYNQPRREINEADMLMARKMMSYIGNFVHGNAPLATSGGQPLASFDQSGARPGDNETVSMDDGETSAAADGGGAAYARPRSWASEGQVHHVELDEVDMLEIQSSAARRRKSHEQQLRTPSSNSTTGDPAASASAIADDRSSVKPAGGDKSPPVSIRLVILDGQQDSEQPQPPPQQLMVPNSRGRQPARRQQQQQQQQQQSAPLMQQPPQPTSHQTNMTLVNESSFVTVLVFCTCLIIFALMSTCLVLCLVVFRSGASLVRAPGAVAVEAAMQRQHYTNSSSSTFNICDDTQGGGVGGPVVGAGKDARGFGNVFAKLGNNTGSQSHHHNQPSQQQHVESQTSARKQIE